MIDSMLLFLGLFTMLKYDDNDDGFTAGEEDNPYEIVDAVGFLSILRFVLLGFGKFNGLLMQAGVSEFFEEKC